LASAIEFLPDGQLRFAEEIREVASRLEASDPMALTHSDMVKDGLVAALRAFVSHTPPAGHELEYQASVRALSRAANAVNVDRPLLDQHETAAMAFRAATDLVTLAGGGEAAFGDAEASIAEGHSTLEAAVADATADVVNLGMTSWTQVPHAASRALLSLATLVATADREGRLAGKVSDIRFQAERLRYGDAQSFGRATWIKDGLTAALDALDSLHPGGEEAVTGWTRASRLAVDGIEEHRSLSFQRAAVQDAFRATLDSLVATIEAPGRSF